MVIRLTTYEHACDVPFLPGNDVFHSTALFRVLEQTPGYRPVLLVASAQSGPVGKMLCVTRQSSRLAGFCRKAYVFGTGEYFGPPGGREEVFREMLWYFTRKFQDDALLLEFRNLEEPLFGYRFFRENNYFPIRWMRVRNSIHHATLDKWMSPSRKRQIARGLKNGAVMETARTRQDVEAFFHMIKKYYSPKIHRYLPDLHFFIALLEQTEDNVPGRIFLVRFKERIIGGAVCLFSRGTAYLLFSAGMRKSYPLQYPGVLAVWGAMTYAREQGLEHFEFIDAGLPFKKYGYRDFILRFGGRQISTRRWFRIRWKWLNRLLIRIYV